MSDCEYEIDGEDFLVQGQEVVIANEDDEDEEENSLFRNNVAAEDDDEEEEDVVIGNVQIVESHGQSDEECEEEDADSEHNSEDSDSGSGSSSSSSSAAASDNNEDEMSDGESKDDKQTTGNDVDTGSRDCDQQTAEDDIGNNGNTDVVEEEDIDPTQIDENGVYKWKEFDGAKIRVFSKDEYEAFQKPFKAGWKRELVLRCTGSTAEKKAGDVYYHTPDGKTKLRSYVEMNQYLKKNPQVQLVVENFSFAKQPVYHPPDEIVRHAMQRGANFIERPFFFNKHIRQQKQPQVNPQSKPQPSKSQSLLSKPAMQSVESTTTVAKNGSINDDSNDGHDMQHGPLGRGKRKRVLPSRYDDNDFDYVPVKKKFKDSMSNGNSQDSNSPQSSNKSNNSMSKMSAQERRRTLQQQLYQQIHEEQIKKEKLEEKQQMSNGNKKGDEQQQQHQSNLVSPLKMKISKPKNNKKSSEEKNNSTVDTVMVDIHEASHEVEQSNDKPNESYRQPCSAFCPGRRNMLPNLLCSRCFCLFHLECVSDGIFLEEPKNLFICPSCVTSEDKNRNESAQTKGNKKYKQLFESERLEKVMDIQSLISPTVAPMIKASNSLLKNNQFLNGNCGNKFNDKRFSKWSKPIMRQSNGFHQPKQQHQQYLSPFSAAQKLKRKPIVPNRMQPSLNHVYRVAHAANGHSVVIKDRTQPLAKTATNWLQEKQSLMDAAQQLARHQYYNTLDGKPAYNLNTAKLFEERFNSMLTMITSGSFVSNSNSLNINSKYYKYLQNKQSILNNFDSYFTTLFKVLQYCDAKDILSLRQTSRQWHRATSLSGVWNQIRLRGLPITNWNCFAQHLQNHKPVLVDFSGVRIANDSVSTNSRSEKLLTFWRQFTTIIPCLTSVRALKFGTIPSFVLQELITTTEAQPSLLAKLESLSITNLIDESNSTEVWLQLASFSKLKSLQIDSLNGFTQLSTEEKFENFLNTLAQLNQLRSFACTSFKNFTAKELNSLVSKLNPHTITSLKLGSCADWFRSAGDMTTFDQLSTFNSIETLQLTEITIGSNCRSFVSLFESLIVVERLFMDQIQIDKSGFSVWNSLIAMFKSLPLVELKFNTDDSFTNRAIFECCRELAATLKRVVHIRWIVTVTIDDVGHCYVPLSLETFPDSLDYDFVKRHFGTNSQKSSPSDSSDQYQIVEQDDCGSVALVEISTLTELINRDCNQRPLVTSTFEPKVSIQIIPK